MPDLKLYTIADLRAWLIDNNPPVGLNEQVIAPVRAWAILNNPYVKDDDAVVAAIYEGDELAAFTACFPDKMSSPHYGGDKRGGRIWWATTLWCNPKYQGKGYGMVVIGSLIESHEGELTLDRWGAKETVEIFTCLGYKTIYTPRYILGDKSINRSTIRGKLSYCVQELSKIFHRTQCPIHHTLYTLKYSTFIDGEAYAFMQAHRGNDLFLREQKMLNWIMQYPFAQSCVLQKRVEKDTVFSSNVAFYQYSVVKVHSQGILIGVYILRNNSGILSIVSLYYKEQEKDIVFASFVEHIVAVKATKLMVEDKALSNYISTHLYFPSKRTEMISLSTPYQLPPYTLQLMDGDSFA